MNERNKQRTGNSIERNTERKKTRPDTRLPKTRACGQGPYLRSLDHLGRSETKDRKKKCDGRTDGPTPDGAEIFITSKLRCRLLVIKFLRSCCKLFAVNPLPKLRFAAVDVPPLLVASTNCLVNENRRERFRIS